MAQAVQLMLRYEYSPFNMFSEWYDKQQQITGNEPKTSQSWAIMLTIGPSPQLHFHRKLRYYQVFRFLALFRLKRLSSCFLNAPTFVIVMRFHSRIISSPSYLLSQFISAKTKTRVRNNNGTISNVRVHFAKSTQKVIYILWMLKHVCGVQIRAGWGSITGESVCARERVCVSKRERRRGRVGPSSVVSKCES